VGTGVEFQTGGTADESTEHQEEKEPTHRIRGNRDVQVVIPYVKGLSEACARIYRKYGAKTAMRPFQTIRNYVVHPKDKLEKEEISELCTAFRVKVAKRCM